MRFNTPLKIALFLSLLILSAACIIFYFFGSSLIVSYCIFFISICYLIYLILNKLFHQKIKVIYKNIYKFKGVSNINELDIDYVEKEAEEWADAKEAELNEYKKDQGYRREFIGNVSHELKTPIFNIQGYIETLLDGGLHDNEVNMKYLQRANKSVDRMINIVEDLEVISHLETEQILVDIQPFSLIELTSEMFEAFEMKASHMNIELFLRNEALSEIVLADRNKIQQVFSNLISNSIKYGKNGGRTEVRFFDMEENILIEISDNGIGIDEESLGRLFERFYRVDKNRSRDIGGTGLGLAIVKHILEGHHQTISVRSKKDLGSTFSFILEKAK